MAGDEEKEGTLVHWLVAGAFTQSPVGARFPVTAESIGDAMANAGLSCKVSVPDRLGAGDKRAFELRFESPKSFHLTEVIAALPELAALRSLAEDLGGADASRRPGAEAVVQRITDAVGAGKLSAAVEAAIAKKPGGAAPAAKSPTATSESPTEPAPSVDAILDQTDSKQKQVATTSAIDGFVRAVRQSGGGSQPLMATSAARAARTLVEEAVFSTVNDIFKDPLVSRFEQAWRGLAMVAAHCNAKSGMSLEVLDVEPSQLPAAFEVGLPADGLEWPDVYFVVDAVDDVARLTELAQAGEGLNAPVIVAVSPRLFGTDDASAVATVIEETSGGLPEEEWGILRGDEASRWLCLATNRAVLGVEGTGAARRVVFGSPVFVLAAMLVASYRDTGSFARIFGANGAMKMPGAWEMATGRDAGTLIPTEAFFSLRAQARAAELGIVGLGSGRNSDKVVLSAARTVRGSIDAVPLPAQVLTGRVVRFALWVRDQIPADATDKDIGTLFEQAAQVFLFGGISEGAGVRAGVGTDKDGKRFIQVIADVKGQHAGIPFHMEFPLPLKH